MSGGSEHGSGNGGMLRKLLIVVVLFWAMAELDTFSSLHGADAATALTMVSFGFIILAAYTLGALAERIRLPHITGYLLAGVACGPHFLGLLDANVIAELKVFDILAIALIAMEAGSALDIGGLRSRWREVTVLSIALIVMSILGGLTFATATSGLIPGIAIPWLDGAGWPMIISVGSLLGVIVMATSPPVTLAVMSEAKAKGRFSDTLLTTVIINNIQVVVLFAVAVALAQALVGAGDHHGGGAGAVLAQLGWSLVLGSVAGWLAAAAMKYLAGDALLAIVGLCFTASWVAGEVDASPLLTFLTAGALLNNATRQGAPFKAVATKLSGPVYVLFFTVVGADLHIDALQTMAPFAIAIVLMRLGGYYAAAKLSGLVVELPPTIGKFGALGLAPQAGIALTVALAVGHDFPGWGMDFETLGLAAIALNEMVGPILLKWSLTLSGDAGGAIREAVEADADPETEEAPKPAQPVPMPRLAEWLPEPSRPHVDPWGGSPKTGDLRLDELCRELQCDLDVMVRDLRGGVIAGRRQTALAFAQLLRKEFLRTHRNSVVRAGDPRVSDEELWAGLARERGLLALRWKGLLLDRGAGVDFKRERQAISGLLEAVERACQTLPSAMTAPIEDEHVATEPHDGFLVAVRKRRVALQRILGGVVGVKPLRVIEPRAIARYIFVGEVPVYLRDAVGLMVVEERYLLAQARNLFEVFDHTVEEATQLARERAAATQDEAEDRPVDAAEDGERDTAERSEILARLRNEMEEEFHLLTEAIDRFSDEIVRVLASALGRAFREFVDTLTVAGTPMLTPNHYRFSRIYEASGRSAAAIFAGLDNAREHTRGSASALAMELDVVWLTEQVRQDTQTTALETGRDVRGRMTHQLGRVQDLMDEAVIRIGQLLHSPPDDPELVLNAIEEILAPLSKVVDEVVGIAQSYRNHVRNDPPYDQLMVVLTSAIDGLTDRFSVVFDPSSPMGRGIPEPPTVVDLAFRELVRAFIESETSRELSNLTTVLQDRVDGFARGIEDIDRMLVFHAELARAELEARAAGPLSRDSVEVLEESLASTLRRLARRSTELQQETEVLAAQVEDGVQAAVLGNLSRLRDLLVTGQVAEIRSRLTQRTLAQGRRELRSAATRAAGVAGQLLRLARATLGEDALNDARKIVGLRNVEDDRALGPDAFAPPAERVEVPTAYRRLFSDRALEAGDMLAGREDDVGRTRRTLVGTGLGSSRAVAIVGVGGMGQGAVMQALVRGLGEGARVHRFELKGPGLDRDTVDEMLDVARQAQTSSRPTVITVDGFQWLFDIRPRGFDLLRHFIAGVIETSRQVGWVVAAERPVWAYADRAVPLHDAFPERMDLDVVDPEALRNAVLARHSMSGYELSFRRPEDNLAWWLRELVNPRARELMLYEDHFFKALHVDSGGVLRDALRLWMASIVAIDPNGDTVWIGSPPHPPIRALRDLPEDLLITLRQVARSGRITAENHAIQFQVPVEMSRALLARLTHWGLLEPDDGGAFCFRDEVAGAIYRVLRERRLVG